MSYESRAYDKNHDDGFGPDPVVVLVVTGMHDVSRLVGLLNGGTPNTEQRDLSKHITRQVNRAKGGRFALSLLKQHGGPDLLEPVAAPEPSSGKLMDMTTRPRPGQEWAVKHPDFTLVPQTENPARFTQKQIPGSVLVRWDHETETWQPTAPAVVDVQLPADVTA